MHHKSNFIIVIDDDYLEMNKNKDFYNSKYNLKEKYILVNTKFIYDSFYCYQRMNISNKIYDPITNYNKN